MFFSESFRFSKDMRWKTYQASATVGCLLLITHLVASPHDIHFGPTMLPPAADEVPREQVSHCEAVVIK